jgi:hypothetical protein
MLRISARDYVHLGQGLEIAARVLMESEDVTQSPYGRVLTEEEQEHLRETLNEVLNECKKLDLRVSIDIVAARIKHLPTSHKELDILIEVIQSELGTQLFLFVNQQRSRYYDPILPSYIQAAFPNAYPEMVDAGNSLALDQFTACVFHSMRAAEIGVRALAEELNVTFPFPLELADWHNMLDQIDSKIHQMKNLPRSAEKDDGLQFYSEAATQFRYFKDAWRVRVAHTRARYDEHAAVKVFDHTFSFFQTIATRLKEPRRV